MTANSYIEFYFFRCRNRGGKVGNRETEPETGDESSKQARRRAWNRRAWGFGNCDVEDIIQLVNDNILTTSTMQFLWWFKWWLLYWRWLCWWGWWITIGWARMMKQSWVKWRESSLLLTSPPPPVSATPLRVRGGKQGGVGLERKKLVEKRWCCAIPFHSGLLPALS